MPATKTPPKGGKPDKLMRDALMVALKREAQDADGGKTNKLNRIATKLVELAADGDLGAIKEIADRVDGRPTATADVNVTGNHTVNHQSADVSETAGWITDMLGAGAGQPPKNTLPN